MRTRIAFCLTLVATFAFVACGDGDDETGGGAPPKTIAEQTCDDLSARIAGCGAASACEQALSRDCAAVAGMLGAPYLQALKGCLDDGRDPASCALAAGAGLTPSEAQHAFAESFCKNCALGIPTCVDLLFGGENAELAPVASLIAPLSDDLVGEITKECTQGLTCLATFETCVEGVLAKRAIPEETMGCFVGTLLGKESASSECSQQGSGGAASTGADSGSGGAQGTGGSTSGVGGNGQGGGSCSADPSEPNDTFSTAKKLVGGGDGILSDCEGDESISGVLAGAGDMDWFGYHGSDGPCGLDSIQPHATVDAADVTVCVYVDPDEDSGDPTCILGSPAASGTFKGCCGDGNARLAYGSNLANDDAEVRISLSTNESVCIEYKVTYGFGDG